MRWSPWEMAQESWLGQGLSEVRGKQFQPFAQKLALSPGSQVVVQGDLHGDVHSLLAALKDLQTRGLLEGFKIVSPETHLLFLGDYTDRGIYGVEVLFTLLRLKCENPTQVWLSRGNHENKRVVELYGFLKEGRRKYGRRFDSDLVFGLFDVLPSVIYVGCGNDFLQSCHGGMEPGYDPQPP